MCYSDDFKQATCNLVCGVIMIVGANKENYHLKHKIKGRCYAPLRVHLMQLRMGVRWNFLVSQQPSDDHRYQVLFILHAILRILKSLSSFANVTSAAAGKSEKELSLQ